MVSLVLNCLRIMTSGYGNLCQNGLYLIWNYVNIVKRIDKFPAPLPSTSNHVFNVNNVLASLPLPDIVRENAISRVRAGSRELHNSAAELDK